MTATQTPAQDVSDADLGAALREFRQHFPLQASAAWHYATERAKDMNVARELQQPVAYLLDSEDPRDRAASTCNTVAETWREAGFTVVELTRISR